MAVNMDKREKDANVKQEKDPFGKFKIQDSSFLEEIIERTVCPKCNRKRKYYCPTCCILVGGIDDKIPNVKLPVKIHIIKHKNEKDARSTAIHAALLAPGDVTIYTYPLIPDYTDKSELLLLFPEGNSTTLANLLDEDNKLSSESDDPSSNKFEKDYFLEPQSKKFKADMVIDNKYTQKISNLSFNTVIFIDSTWSQSKRIKSDDRLKGIKTVHIDDRLTLFWRPQNKPDTHLATIEAIYYFLCDLYVLTNNTPYNGKFDNLLFFFAFIFKKVSNKCMENNK